MNALPLPIAALRRRSHNAKSAKERHDTAHFAWEASIRLAVAAQPPLRMVDMASPTLGHWVSALRCTNRPLKNPTLRKALELFAAVQLDPDAMRSRALTDRALFEAFVAYRNRVLGHGSIRPARFYEHAARVLVEALDTAWAEGLFLSPQAKVIYVETIEVTEQGGKRARVLDLTGIASHADEYVGSPATDAEPGRLYLLEGGRALTLHPWVVYQGDEQSERILFFNRMTQRACFLDFVSGEEAPAAKLNPTLEKFVRSAWHATGADPNIDAPSDANRFGDYDSIGTLGEGGMGIVYLARQVPLDRLVALKRIRENRATDSLTGARFLREIRALSRCDHSNIVKILAEGSERGQRYFAMELVAGADFATLLRHPGASDLAHLARVEWNRLLRERGLPAELEVDAGPRPHSPDSRTRQLATLFRDAALAIHYLHTRGILHRDIKPSNLMVTIEGRLVVMDLGLAAIDNASSVLTQNGGSMIGTLRYAAPEQMLGRSAVVDRRTDVYALGATFFEALTGRPLFSATSEAELVHDILHSDMRSPRAIDARIPTDLDLILQKCVARDPELRYATAEQLSHDLEAYLQNLPVSARRPTMFYLARLAARRHRGLAIAIAAVGGATATLGAAAFSRERSLRAEAVQHRQSAERERTRAEGALAAARLEQARQELLDGSPARAVALLAEESPAPTLAAVRNFLLGEAFRSLAGNPVVLRGHRGPVKSVDVSPNGGRILTAGVDGTVRVWAAIDGAPLRTIEAHHGAVLSAAFSPDGTSIASVGVDRAVRIHDAVTGNRTAERSTDRVAERVTWCPRGETHPCVRWIANGHSENVETAWYFAENRVADRPRSDDGAFHRDAELATPDRELAFDEAPLRSNQGVVFATAHDGRVRFMRPSDTRAPRALREVAGNADRSLRVDPSGRIAATEIEAFGLGSARTVLHGDGRFEPAFTGDGAFLLLSKKGARSVVAVVDLASTRVVRDLEGDDACAAGTGPVAATARGDTVLVWDLLTGARTTTLPVGGVVIGLHFTPDDRALFVATARSISRWTVATGHMHWSSPIPKSHALSFDVADSTGLVAFGTSGGSVHVLDGETGRPVAEATPHGGAVWTVAFDPQGQHVLSSSDDGSARLSQARTGKVRAPLFGHQGAVVHGAFDGTGALVATASSDGKVRVWAAESGRLLAWRPLQSPGAVRFTPNGNTLLITSGKGVYAWDVTPDSRSPEAVRTDIENRGLPWHFIDGRLAPRIP